MFDDDRHHFHENTVIQQLVSIRAAVWVQTWLVIAIAMFLVIGAMLGL